ncbi:hypothetical protein OC835_006203 [Tilletia horrida]|nr:hypothetical protein OC835_006203 [Tilletia horrida]
MSPPGPPYDGGMTYSGPAMVSGMGGLVSEDITSNGMSRFYAAEAAIYEEYIDGEGQPRSPPSQHGQGSPSGNGELASPFSDRNAPSSYRNPASAAALQHSGSEGSIHSRSSSFQNRRQGGSGGGVGESAFAAHMRQHPLAGAVGGPSADILPSIPTSPGLRSSQGLRSRPESPGLSRPFHMPSPSQAAQGTLRRRRYFTSTALPEGYVAPKPWLDSKTRKSADRKTYWLMIVFALLGLVSIGLMVAFAALDQPHDEYCLIMQDDFDGDVINRDIWSFEQQTGGFGNKEFEWTTDSTNNSYVKDGYLHIVPTLTSDQFGEDAITNGGVLNLTASGKCTAAVPGDDACAVASNLTKGIVLPPIQSARLTTNFSKTIRYGRVEVKARLPTGDWIWPAIWMMPRDSVYGAWPASGEIDIMESSGNTPKTRNDGGWSKMISTLHWGPTTDLNRYWMTTVDRKLFRKFYNSDFHTFGLEWNEKELFTWEGSPARKILSVKFKEDFWTLGKFPPTSPTNNTAVSNPWASAKAMGSKTAPFDQYFNLILSVAVGGTNGYFPDSDNKPWSNSARNPRADFWATRNKWLPSWPTEPERRGMVVDSVKMWQKGPCAPGAGGAAGRR